MDNTLSRLNQRTNRLIKKPASLSKIVLAKELPPSPTKSEQLFRGQLNVKKMRAKRPARIEQWIEVRVHLGVVTTSRYPSNDLLIRKGQTMWPPPQLVYRRINFPDGIPREYEWTGVQDEMHRTLGGCGIQRMTVDTWLETIEQEFKLPDGHLMPVPSLPRPLACGECSCPNCQLKYAKMANAGN